MNINRAEMALHTALTAAAVTNLITTDGRPAAVLELAVAADGLRRAARNARARIPAPRAPSDPTPKENTVSTDIYSWAETRGPDGSWSPVGDVFPLDDYDRKAYGKERGHEPFAVRNYSLFSWLAGVRNWASVTPLSEPRGLPADVSAEVREDADWAYSPSWFTLAELLAVDYDTRVPDPDEDGVQSLRRFLDTEYFETLNVLQTLGEPDAVRVVFWFD